MDSITAQDCMWTFGATVGANNCRHWIVCLVGKIVFTTAQDGVEHLHGGLIVVFAVIELYG
jgi:hypothetical protein